MCMSADEASGPTMNREFRSSRRMKLWQIDPAYHCSIIGTCLSLKELRQVVRKFDLSVENTISDYELHSLFVNSAQSPTDPIRYLHKLLDKKYAQPLKSFNKARTMEDAERSWNEAIESGNINAAFWAIQSSEDISLTLRNRVIGDVHMLSHLSGASIRKDIASLGKLRDEQCTNNETYTKQAVLLERRLGKKDAEIRDLREKNANQQVLLSELEKNKLRVVELEKTSRQCQLELMVENVSGQFYTALSRANLAEQRVVELENQVSRLSVDNGVAEKIGEGYLSQLKLMEVALEHSLNNSPETVYQNNLQGKKLLYVGGRESQSTHMRMLVEQSNGTFIYHDGGKNDGRQRLNSILQKVDTVLCPMDCVSHDAFCCVKKHCERLHKQLVLVPHASLSSFVKGLEEVTV